jgi:hypothetical protein
MPNKNYYYYIEKVNSLNTLEKITYELVMFQKSPLFLNLYNEAQETETKNENIESIEGIAKKLNIKSDSEISILKKTLLYLEPSINNYLFDLKIATSFGLGIGGLIPFVMTFMNRMEITVSRENAIMIAAGVVLSIIYTNKKETTKIKKLTKKLINSIKDKKLKRSLIIIMMIGKKLWIPVDKALEFLAYTITAIPFANFLSSFLRDVNFDPTLAKQALTGLAIGAAVHIFRQTAPIFWGKFTKFFKRRGKK